MEIKPIKVLLVDDDEDDYIMTRDLLSEVEGIKYDLQWIHNYNEALDVVAQRNHDIYLFDYRLGERTGLELLEEAVYKGCKAPIILLTGQGNHELDMEAMRSGAADYLVKGYINSHLLERSIRYAIERKRTEEYIYRMAYYDSLTNLPNRLLFIDRLKQAIGLAERYGRMLAVLFLDLDNFKRINDTFGHSIGDNLLINIAERLKNSMRKCDSLSRHNLEESVDTVARLGGDEFTILLTEIKHIEDAAKVTQRIIDNMVQPFVLNNFELFITASIGIAVYPHDGEDIDSLLKNADSAMYHAKTEGKNIYQYYKQSMNATAFERLAIENNLRKAIEHKEFVLYYQPQIDVKTGKLAGFEALIRWQTPDNKIIMPSEFIPVAEETALIVPLGHWLLNAACLQGKAWQDAGVANLPISVNISSQQFQQKNFAAAVRDILDQTGIDPANLIFEITESTLMQNTETVFATLHELSEMGLRLIIDDFGTGYSSLNYLKRFPLYSIKIDRSFTKELTTNPDDAAITKAIISMAHSLKLKVIAEGVETEEQLAFLCKHCCDEVQGFLFSRPVPAEEITKLLSMEKTGRSIVLSSVHKILETAQKA